VTDVAVVGAGVVGCAAAAFLAEAGAAVEVWERADVAAGASGRNSGVIQHPMDPVLAPLYVESLALHREVVALPGPPAGVLLVDTDAAPLARLRDALAAANPELAPEVLEDARAAEPALADGIAALRLETGHPVPPASATRAWAARAQAAGARFHVGEAWPARSGGTVLVCAGPWTPAAAGVPLPIRAVWGVVGEVVLEHPPHHVVEEAGVEDAAEGGAPHHLFSIVTAEGRSGVGSTFAIEEPDPDAVAPGLVAEGARFVPALRDAAIVRARACARPQSVDGRPLLGRVADDVWVAAGHGPWGISLGPASARLVADAILGRGDGIPAAFDPGRFSAG